MPARIKREWFVDGLAFWHRLWSVRLAGLGVICGIVGQVLSSLPGRGFMIAGVVLTVASAVASVVKQPDLLADIEAKKCPPSN